MIGAGLIDDIPLRVRVDGRSQPRVLRGVALAAVARAAIDIPLVLVHPGRVLDVSDRPAAGTHRIKFSLYPTSVLETSNPAPAVWSETYAVTVGTGGLYAVRLGDKGSQEARKLELTAAHFAGLRWLAVRVGQDF